VLQKCKPELASKWTADQLRELIPTLSLTEKEQLRKVLLRQQGRHWNQHQKLAYVRAIEFPDIKEQKDSINALIRQVKDWFFQDDRARSRKSAGA
jgi:hypothetical protein